MTTALRIRRHRLCCAAGLASALAWLVLQAPVALAQWGGYGGAPRAPQRPGGGGSSGGSAVDWPAPGMPQQGLPTLQDYNRTVNYWIRRTGPMGIDRCALSDLFQKPCEADE